jgi:hypothetical protein
MWMTTANRPSYWMFCLTGIVAVLWAHPETQGSFDVEAISDDTCETNGDCSLSLRQLRAHQSQLMSNAEDLQSSVNDLNSNTWGWASSDSESGKYTGGSCMWSKCDASRGPTVCSHRRCLCQDGYIAAGGSCIPEQQGSTMNPDTKTGVSCKYSGYCDLGHATCVEGSCFCVAGYAAKRGRCLPAAVASIPTTAALSPDAAVAPSFAPVPAPPVIQSAGGSMPQTRTDCEDALPGSDCYTKASWAKSDGVFSHPDWYPGLTGDSHISKFQEALFRSGQGGCKLPCTIKDLDCEDAVPGTDCYANITWAKSDGIHSNPEWYPGLTATDENYKFQETLYRAHQGGCKLPCTKGSTAVAAAPAAVKNDGCEDAQPGSTCFEKATWAKNDGIHAHPEWYPGVTEDDHLSKFQDALFKTGQADCKRPCHIVEFDCEDALPGSDCYGNITFAKSDGIFAHPEWYPGLTAADDESKFQETLYRAHQGGCKLPCKG